MHHQSKMQQLMIKLSYRMHKKRLSSMKHNNMSLPFYSSSLTKTVDRKKLMIIQERKYKIKRENSILQEKINKIKAKQFKEQPKRQHSNKKQKKIVSKRYNEENQQQFNPIQVNSILGNQVMKCVVPGLYSQNKNFSQLKKFKALNHTIWGLRKPQRTAGQNSQNRITLQIRQSLFTKGEELPLKVIDKIILYKKTTIIRPMISCLIEISLTNQKMLITAYIMGAENRTATYLLDERKTNQLILAYSDNFQSLGNKISIDSNWQIKLPIAQNDDIKADFQNNTKKVKQCIKKIKKYASQQDFINRNHYIKYKKQQITEHNNQRLARGYSVLPKSGIKPSYNSQKDISKTFKNTTHANSFCNSKQRKKTDQQHTPKSYGIDSQKIIEEQNRSQQKKYEIEECCLSVDATNTNNYVENVEQDIST